MDILVAVGLFTGISFILGITIGFCSEFFYVKVDNRIEYVHGKLPGANCGGCGYAGCSGMAEAIVTQGVSPKRCRPCKPEVAEEIKLYLEATPGPDGNVIKIKD